MKAGEEIGTRGMAEIKGEKPLLERRVKAVVRGEIGEVEERRVEARVVPIDQPEPLAVIDQIPGEEIVVAKCDLDRPDEALEPARRLS